LTTRIECSRRPTQIGPSETNSSRFNYGPSACLALDQPWIIAGKRADPIQGSNVFLAACQRPLSDRSPTGNRFTLEPWENASRSVS